MYFRIVKNQRTAQRGVSLIIVLLLLVIVSLAAGYIGYLIFRRMHPPRKTIESVEELRSIVPSSFGGATPSQPSHPGIPAARDLQRD